MQGIPLNERKRLGALLDDRPQAEVMAMIPQFSQAETDNFVAPPAQIPEALGVLMFNMERGVNLPEIQEFLRDCPDIQPFDVILATSWMTAAPAPATRTPPVNWHRRLV